MIYFDNASTTPINTDVADCMCNALREVYGNPSSLHKLGFQAEQALNNARKQLETALNLPKGDIFFTSGGTEANNTAVIGTALAYKSRGMRVVTSVTEHPSVGDSFKRLEKLGFDVVYLKPQQNGMINPNDLMASVNSETTLVSIMYVNNETGAIQPIDKFVDIIKEKNANCKVHTDCVQAFGKHPLPQKADLVTVSSHKVNGPKGVGALWTKQGTRVENLHFGGGQEKTLRPGTENSSGIIGFGLASEIACKNLDEKLKKVQLIKNELLKITDLLPDVYVNGSEESEISSPYILNLTFDGVRGEVLLHTLEASEIYVATGSACSTKLNKKQKIVDFLKENRGEGAVRFSFSANNTVEEAKKTSELLVKQIPLLRRFQPR